MADHHDNNLQQWLNGELSDEDFRREAGTENHLKYVQILQEIEKWTPDSQPMNISPQVFTSKGKVVKLNRWIYMSVAATVLLTMFLGIWFLGQSDSNTYMAELGQTKEILLPDGKSKVILSSLASVSWEESDWSDDARSIHLTGKALFQVNPGSPFTVNTTTGNVRVLGTIFEVQTYGSSLSVACFEGKVRATAEDGSNRIVNGGEAFIYHNNQWEEKQIISGSGPLWQKAETRFADAPLEKVIETLKQEYGLTIDSKNIDLNRRFTGTIPNDNLDLALKLVFTPLNISYELKDKQLTLSE